jgi:hypothetical protein
MSTREDLIPAIIKPMPVDEPATVAGLEGKLASARNEADIHRARAEKLVANLGKKAGKHGPVATQDRKETVLLRIAGDPLARLDKIARGVGCTRASLLTMLAVAASRVPPERWFEALAALNRGK